MSQARPNNPARAVRGGWVAALTLLALMAGCQGKYRSFADRLDERVAAGDYRGASELAVSAAERKAGDRVNRVVYNLEAARAAQISGDLETSRTFFDRVHADVRPYLDERAEAYVTEGASTTLVNQSMAVYRGTPVDRVMASAFNAVNLIALGEHEAARVQLNLARDWQDDAVRRASGRIGRDEERLERQAAERGVRMDDQRVGGILNTHYAELVDLRAYSDARNPFASHLRGVFLLSASPDTSDTERARFELREVLGMEPGAGPMVLPDLERIERGEAAEPTTWVYIMAGRGPWLEELRLDIPIPAGNVNYVAAAFPRIRFHDDYIGAPVVGAGGERAEAVLLADVDAMVAAEFRERLPRIITQEILSAGLKAAATYGAREAEGGWAQLLGMIYQAATTSADTRGWRTLPKRVLLARVPTPADGRVTVESAGVRAVVDVEPGRSHIVMVTVPSRSAQAPSVVRASLDPNWQEVAREK